jgi:ribonuclease VapC
VSDERYLLDASALLALVQEEPAGKDVEPVLDRAAIHAVNLVEVITKLIQNGLADAVPLLAKLGIEVISELDAEQAEACGRLHAGSRKFGLSLGDCVCLTMARAKKLVAVTKEKIWEEAVKGWDIRVLTVPIKPFLVEEFDEPAK